MVLGASAPAGVAAGAKDPIKLLRRTRNLHASADQGATGSSITSSLKPCDLSGTGFNLLNPNETPHKRSKNMGLALAQKFGLPAIVDKLQSNDQDLFLAS